MRTIEPPTYLFTAIRRDIEAIERKLNKLENQKTPTMPRPGTIEELGPVGVFGQLAIADDDILYCYMDDGWSDGNL